VAKGVAVVAEDGKKPRKKKLLLFVLPAMLMAGVGAKMTVFKGETDTEEVEHAEPLEGEIVDVGSLTVNLADEGRRYARVGIALVLSETADAEEVANRIPLLKDAASTKIASHSSLQLRTPEGKELLRGELTEAAREVWEGDEVLRVALTEILVQ
jgi:flagellar basal body-associated protein FliL